MFVINIISYGSYGYPTSNPTSLATHEPPSTTLTSSWASKTALPQHPVCALNPERLEPKNTQGLLFKG